MYLPRLSRGRRSLCPCQIRIGGNFCSLHAASADSPGEDFQLANPAGNLRPMESADPSPLSPLAEPRMTVASRNNLGASSRPRYATPNPWRRLWQVPLLFLGLAVFGFGVR